MPKFKIKVTPQGFANCPSCLNYIEVEPRIGDTDCPFCGTNLAVATVAGDDGSLVTRVLKSSRTGLVAAALVGLSLTACGTADPKNNGTNNGTNNGAADMGDDAADMVDPDPINNGTNNGVFDYAAAPLTKDD